MNYNFLFVDLEMTGLDSTQDVILEIAATVTDANLSPIAEPFHVIIKPDQLKIDLMSPEVLRMHTASGLLNDLVHGVSHQQAYDSFLAYVTDLALDKKKLYLAGNSIWKDREFLAAQMPLVLEKMHYRIVDISTLKTLVGAWLPQHVLEKKSNKHRASDDIAGSIQELAAYKKLLFEQL